MTSIESKFKALGTDNAPGQEVRSTAGDVSRLMVGEPIHGTFVDFSHGDVDAFVPTPGAFERFQDGVEAGGRQAYTEYRGSATIRDEVAARLATFTGASVSSEDGLIITPGTQGALFLAMASVIAADDKVAIVQPDYFANRKIVEFLGGRILPVQLDYFTSEGRAGFDVEQLREAFDAGAKVLVFSNPNNPTGAVYSSKEIHEIAQVAGEYGATVVVDQLYSRLLYSDAEYTHLRAQDVDGEHVVTIMGPSKTESLSGYRLGVAFGSKHIISRMEKLQAIVSLRAPGYSQAVLRTWFNEPMGWMAERIRLHESIRDDLLRIFREARLNVRKPQAGSYLFPQLPALRVRTLDFVRLLRLQADVTVTPGSEFSPHTAGSIRLNFSQDPVAAAAAARRIVEMTSRYQT
ncbi:pyridoxal phosphate-dependent aminotransferase [Paraburkholderia acidicola]|uniref:Pyridoxal phosphate-dependent aminotransferase n=1 Tax=Paraburkholderia acidicola TaxID=1912599 RepID=A0ABV1LUI7_9BURK